VRVPVRVQEHPVLVRVQEHPVPVRVARAVGAARQGVLAVAVFVVSIDDS